MPDSLELRRIVVVDDEKPIADSLAMILKLKRYEVYAAYSAEEAIPLVARVDPHIVITDVVMGELTGFDLARYVVEHNRKCKVLLISGHVSTEELIRHSRQEGLDFPVLPKPVHPEEILDLLAAWTFAA